MMLLSLILIFFCSFITLIISCQLWGILGVKRASVTGDQLATYTFLAIKEPLKGNVITKEERRKVFWCGGMRIRVVWWANGNKEKGSQAAIAPTAWQGQCSPAFGWPGLGSRRGTTVL